MSLFLYLFLLWAVVKISKARHPKHPIQLNVYFGVPGAGKTTYAAYLSRECFRESIVIRLCKRFPSRLSSWILNGKSWKRKIPVWSNVPIAGTYKLNAREDIGVYDISCGKMIIDEAGVEFNNRDYKAFPKAAIKFFKYHRHCKVSVDVFSQSFDDMDVTIRRLAQNFYVVKRSLIPYMVVIKRITRKVGIDENTHQITDCYSFGLPILDTKRIWCPPLWKMFDSYDYDPLPPKEWKTWGADDTPVDPPATPPSPTPTSDTPASVPA